MKNRVIIIEFFNLFFILKLFGHVIQIYNQKGV